MAGIDDTARIDDRVAAAHREHWTTVLAATLRVADDLELAEDCVQEAYIAALTAWTEHGVPDNVAGWLVTTARRKALDARRRADVLTSKLPLLLVTEPIAVPGLFGPDDQDVTDDRLRLIFTCCHPALDRQAQAALTLRIVCGVPTAEVARAFLVSETAMAARLTRAKRKIATARIPYRVPAAAELPDRLDAVLTVVHLLFTAAHSACLVDVVQADELADRSLRLARLLVELMPDEPEPRGLLALMLLSQSRRHARVVAGRLVLLADQDRSTWDAGQIEEGLALVPGALRAPRPGRFAVQAAISALHAEATSAEATDWPQIVALYDELLGVWPSHVVALNRAAAVAEVHGPAVALRLVDQLAAEPRLQGYLYFHATRADLLRRLGRRGEAAASYRTALDLCEDDPERDFLSGRIHEVTSPAIEMGDVRNS